MVAGEKKTYREFKVEAVKLVRERGSLVKAGAPSERVHRTVGVGFWGAPIDG